MPPPRPDEPEPPPDTDTTGVTDDIDELRTIAERLLAGVDSVSMVDVLDDAGDWMSARRVLAEVAAIHHHPDLGYELMWEDGLRIKAGASPSWASRGQFRRAAGARGTGDGK